MAASASQRERSRSPLGSHELALSAHAAPPRFRSFDLGKMELNLEGTIIAILRFADEPGAPWFPHLPSSEPTETLWWPPWRATDTRCSTRPPSSGPTARRCLPPWRKTDARSGLALKRAQPKKKIPSRGLGLGGSRERRLRGAALKAFVEVGTSSAVRAVLQRASRADSSGLREELGLNPKPHGAHAGSFARLLQFDVPKG